MNGAYVKKLGLLTGFLMCVVIAGAAGEQADKTPKPPRCFKELGGSNYVMYRVGKEYLNGNADAWFNPGVLEPVVATFHQQKKEDVLAQLQAMYDSGQRKISILIWHDHLTPAQRKNDDVYGHVLASNGGVLQPQHEQNLKDLLSLIRESGFFNELIFRFAQQGAAWPQEWKEWNEELFQENEKFIMSVRQQVRKVLQGSDMKLTFDLGAELGGIKAGCATEYTKRLWAEYTRKVGTEDTFGFSFAAHPTRIRRWLEVCDEVGVRPDRFALDLYDYIPDWMPKIIPEFYDAGIKDPKIIILETYWNDPQSLKELQQIADQFSLQYEFLMQWPFQRGSAPPHFSGVFDRPEYDAYLRD